MLGQGCSLLRKPALPKGDVLQTMGMAVVLPAELPAASCIHSRCQTPRAYSLEKLSTDSFEAKKALTFSKPVHVLAPPPQALSMPFSSSFCFIFTG